MTFISYAQNFEDVMLWRALKHVENGFYIDIGAQNPVVDSVSMAFYEHDWRGVHIEPTQQYSNMLRHARPDEIVNQVAIGNTDGKIQFYEFLDTGLSTADFEIAQRHCSAGYIFTETEVSIVSLDSILEKYADKNIHWLKLDVEGYEKDVLESWQASTCRPWILVIESLKPITQEQSHEDWELMVLDKGYIFAYFDGLNRFYVHEQHHELTQSFSSPPNIFDGFVLSGTASQPFYQLVAERAEQAEAKAEQAEAKAEQAEAKAEQAEAKAEQAEATLISIRNSSSWQLTAPLRLVSTTVKSLLKLLKVASSSIKESIKRFLIHANLFANRWPWLKLIVLKLLTRTPLLERRLRLMATGVPTAQKKAPLLTPRANRIFMDLKAAIANQKKDCS